MEQRDGLLLILLARPDRIHAAGETKHALLGIGIAAAVATLTADVTPATTPATTTPATPVEAPVVDPNAPA